MCVLDASALIVCSRLCVAAVHAINVLPGWVVSPGIVIFGCCYCLSLLVGVRGLFFNLVD